MNFQGGCRLLQATFLSYTQVKYWSNQKRFYMDNEYEIF